MGSFLMKLRNSQTLNTCTYFHVHDQLYLTYSHKYEQRRGEKIDKLVRKNDLEIIADSPVENGHDIFNERMPVSCFNCCFHR